MNKLPDKVIDWADIVSDRLVTMVKAVIAVNPDMDAADALECVLAKSCAGPKAIRYAQDKLNIPENER